MANKKEAELCSKKPCSIKAFLVPTTVVFFVILIFEYLFHDNLMKHHYEATANLWRSPEAMEAMLNIYFINIAIIASIITALYCYMNRNGGLCTNGSLKFGLLIGSLMGIRDFSAYFYMPISLELALSWLLGSIVLGLFIGIALNWVKKTLCK